MSKMDIMTAQWLAEQRKLWRMSHRFGFVAVPSKNIDGTSNLFNWECAIPGQKGTIWEGGSYKVRLLFPDDWPHSPPECRFEPHLFHANGLPSGKALIPALAHDWNSMDSVEDVLVELQNLLVHPTTDIPNQSEAYNMYTTNRAAYDEKVRDEVRKYKNM